MSRYIRPPSRRISKSSPQVGDQVASRAAVAIGRQVSNNMGQADTSRIGRGVSGNALDAQAVVTFARADTDYFVSHKLGFRVDNFDILSPSAPAHFSMGSKPPNVYGMWIRCDTAGVTARIRMHGQRGVRG